MILFTLIFTGVCYLKSINYLKSLQIQFQQDMDLTIKLLYLNPVSQLILFTPSLIVLSKSELNIDSEKMGFLQNIAPVFLGFSGLVNTSVYMIQRKVSQRRKTSCYGDPSISLVASSL